MGADTLLRPNTTRSSAKAKEWNKKEEDDGRSACRLQRPRALGYYFPGATWQSRECHSSVDAAKGNTAIIIKASVTFANI